MGTEKLQQLAELDEERKSLELRLHEVNAKIDRVIGPGFEIAGARVVPRKRPKKLTHEQLTGDPVLHLGTVGEAPASGSAAVEALLNENKDQRWAAAEVASKLGIELSKASSALYWLYKNGKVARPERGLYQSYQKAA